MEGIDKIRHPLVKWRENNGLSQKAAAELLEITRQSLCRFERVKRYPSLAQAAKLSEKTGIPLDKFVRPLEAAE